MPTAHARSHPEAQVHCAEAPPDAAEAAPPANPAGGISGSWHGDWGGRTIRLRLMQFDALVVGDLSIEGLNLRIAGGVDALGALAWSSSESADPHVSYRTCKGGWRLVAHGRRPELCGALQRRTVRQPSPAGRPEMVVQYEAVLTPDKA